MFDANLIFCLQCEIDVFIHFFSYKFVFWTSSYTSKDSFVYVVHNITFSTSALAKVQHFLPSV